MPSFYRLRDEDWIREVKKRLTCKVMAVVAFGSVSLFVILVAVIYHSLLNKEPNPPLLELHPRPDDRQLPLIHVDSEGEWKEYFKSMDNFIHSYDPSDDAHMFSDCHGLPDGRAAPENHSCFFDTNVLGECGVKGKAVCGYAIKQPCIFLNPNKIDGWKPKYFRNLTEVPKEVPQQLLDEMKEAEKDGQLPERLWVSCQGKNAADKEMMGSVSYLPHPYFSSFYFPYKEDRPYHAPIVALHFKDVTPGVVVHVICRAWANNIEDRRPSVQFELLVD